MGLPLLLVLLLVGILGSAFFSGAEIAVISCSRLRMRHLAREGNRAALAVERIQPAGKRVLATAEFLRGYPLQPGDRFGEA
jgi:Mg2+/Co2+ transporter CorB